MCDGGEPSNPDHHLPVVPGKAAGAGVVAADENGDPADDLEVAQAHDNLVQSFVSEISVNPGP